MLDLPPEGLQRAINQLLTFSQIRKLEKTIKQQMPDMPITIDITQSEIYQEGLEKGLQKGKQSGIAEGKKQAIEGFLKLGKLSEQEIAEALNVSLDYVLEIEKNMNKL